MFYSSFGSPNPKPERREVTGDKIIGAACWLVLSTLFVIEMRLESTFPSAILIFPKIARGAFKCAVN